MNITYDIIEKTTDISQNTHVDQLGEIDKNLHKKLDDYTDDSILALQIDYDLNYNYNYLSNILEFYKIKKINNKKAMNKDNIIKKIVEFETNPLNKTITKERMRLFSNYIELKNHKFFNKFIINTF
jgi:hypothetical protein